MKPAFGAQSAIQASVVTKLEIISGTTSSGANAPRQGALVQVVDPAVMPDRPSNLFRAWIALGALLFSLPVALLAVGCAEGIAVLRRSRVRAGSWGPALELLIGDEA